MQSIGILRPRGGGRSAANILKVMVFHWFYNVSATVPMTLPMGKGPGGRQPGLDADGGICRNTTFYKVLYAFWINYQKMQTVEMFSILVPFVKPYVLQCFRRFPAGAPGRISTVCI